MSEQTATRFQDLLDLLNLQDEDGASAAASAGRLRPFSVRSASILCAIVTMMG